MIRIVFTCLLLQSSILIGNAQSAANKNIQNLYAPNFRNNIFLGMDFSLIKLEGDFTEVLGVGGEASSQTKKAYFKSWNNLVSGERENYNIKEMVKNQNIAADIETLI